MPAGNPVINTASSFPPRVGVGRSARTQQLLAHSLPTDTITRRTPAVPTNEQRRATAKRKLERQLERRAQKARRRRLLTIVGSVVGAIVVIGAVVATVVIPNRDSGNTTASASTSTPTSSTPAGGAPPAPGAPGGLPPFAAPADLGANCQ